MLKMDYLMLMFGKEQQRNDPRSVKDLLNCFLLYFSFPPLVAGSNFSFGHMLNFSSRLLCHLTFFKTSYVKTVKKKLAIEGTIKKILVFIRQ